MRHFLGGFSLGELFMFCVMARNGYVTKKNQTVNGSTMLAYGLIFGTIAWGLWP